MRLSCFYTWTLYTVIYLKSIQQIFEYQVNLMINLSSPDETEEEEGGGGGGVCDQYHIYQIESIKGCTELNKDEDRYQV